MFNIKIVLVNILITVHSLGSVHAEPRLAGLWSNNKHIIGVLPTGHQYPYTGQLAFNSIDLIGIDYMLRGDLFIVEHLDAQCVYLYPGESFISILQSSTPEGVICIDIIDATLIVGYSLAQPISGCYYIRERNLFDYGFDVNTSTGFCSGSLTMEKLQ